MPCSNEVHAATTLEALVRLAQTGLTAGLGGGGGVLFPALAPMLRQRRRRSKRGAILFGSTRERGAGRKEPLGISETSEKQRLVKGKVVVVK